VVAVKIQSKCRLLKITTCCAAPHNKHNAFYEFALHQTLRTHNGDNLPVFGNANEAISSALHNNNIAVQGLDLIPLELFYNIFPLCIIKSADW
jgi:hypothetical protein